MRKARLTGETSSSQLSRPITPSVVAIGYDVSMRCCSTLILNCPGCWPISTARLSARQRCRSSNATAGLNGARLWKEGVPEYVQLQVMHQLAVTGKQAADVAVLLGGQHLEIHRIERDESLIARLIDLEWLFWDYVVSDTPPPADGSASAEQALRCLYPQDSGQSLDFSQDTLLCTTFTELQNVRESIALQEKQEAQLKQTLQQAMGDASRATFATGSITWKKAKDSVALDIPRLLKEKPYLQVRYSTTKTGSRRFLLA